MDVLTVEKGAKADKALTPGLSPYPLAGLVFCFTLLFILYFKTLVFLVHDWITLPDFSHGFVVVPVSLYLVWQRRVNLKAPASPSNWGLPVLLFGLLLFFLGGLAAEVFTQRFSLLVVIAGLVLFLFGKQHLKTIAFPLSFLILMIPLPTILLQKITFPMQLFASRCAGNVLDFLSIPALREGNVLYLSNVTLNVAEACSGLSSMMSFLTIGTLFAYFKNKLLWQRLLVIASAIPIAILSNALRVSATGVIGYYLGPKAIGGSYHELTGFVLFLLVAAFFYALAELLCKIKN